HRADREAAACISSAARWLRADEFRSIDWEPASASVAMRLARGSRIGRDSERSVACARDVAASRLCIAVLNLASNAAGIDTRTGGGSRLGVGRGAAAARAKAQKQEPAPRHPR